MRGSKELENDMKKKNQVGLNWGGRVIGLEWGCGTQILNGGRKKKQNLKKKGGGKKNNGKNKKEKCLGFLRL